MLKAAGKVLTMPLRHKNTQLISLSEGIQQISVFTNSLEARFGVTKPEAVENIFVK